MGAYFNKIMCVCVKGKDRKGKVRADLCVIDVPFYSLVIRGLPWFPKASISNPAAAQAQ